MAKAIRNSGARFDVRAEEARPLFGGLGGGPLSNGIGFCKDTLQGACGGLLTVLGATHMSAAQTSLPITTAASNIGSITGVLQQLSVGALAGPLELLGGVALFLTARRTIARTLGVLVFIGYLAARVNGYELSEILTIAASFLAQASEVIYASAQQLSAA